MQPLPSLRQQHYAPAEGLAPFQLHESHQVCSSLASKPPALIRHLVACSCAECSLTCSVLDPTSLHLLYAPSTVSEAAASSLQEV